MIRTAKAPGQIGVGRCAKLGTMLLAAATLAACGHETRIDRHALNQLAAPTDAVALPPPGGPAVLSVIERRYSNAIQQDIVLAASTRVPGQNLLRVQMFGPVGVDGGDTALTNRHPGEASIASEMRALIPNVRMQRSSLFVQNSYGPFGYAVGRHISGDTCLYAWQRIRRSTGGPFGNNMGTIQVRLRLCQSGATEEALMAVMYGYTIISAFDDPRWNPLGAPAPADPRLGKTGQPIYPTAAGVYQFLVAQHKPAPSPRVARTLAARPSSPEPAQPPSGPLVPPPPGPAAATTVTVPPPPPEQPRATGS